MSALPFPTRVTSPRRYREVVHRGVEDAQYHFRIGLPPDFTSVLRSAPRPSPRLLASGIGFFLGPDEATHASVYATT
ncbi:MAG TPA: hypothetical protein VMQ81_06535, partial [Acidimicrobiia bacterium]|nr:hypothetical protein [Acidimicrobiia bacterium]